MNISFDPNGNPIPYEIVELLVEEVQRNFVSNSLFEVSKNRPLLFNAYTRYLLDLSNLLNSWLKQWLDGSFTTSKIEPRDIDLVNFVSFDVFNRLLSHPDFWKFKTDPYFGTDSKTLYNVDAYFVPVYPEAHPLRSVTETRMDYWEKEFGSDRNGNPKAIFQLRFFDSSGGDQWPIQVK